MSKNNKHIDDLFRDNLKEFEESPPVYAWDRLKDDLLQIRRRKRVLYLQWAAAAAAIIIAFIAGYYVATSSFDQQIAEESEIPSSIESNTPTTDPAESDAIPTEKIAASDDQIARPATSVRTTEKRPETESNNSKEILAEVQTMKQNIPSENIHEKESGIGEDPTPEMVITEEIQNDRVNITTEKQFISPEGELIENTDKEVQTENLPDREIDLFDDIQKEKNMRNGLWKLGGKFAPVYSYRNISIATEDLPDNVIPGESYYNNSENGLYAFAAGLDITYNSEKRWGFQTGLFYSKLGQVIEDVIAFRYPGEKYEFYISTSTGPLEINSSDISNNIDQGEIREDSTGNLLYINSDIYQNFAYIEVPVILNYNLLDQRFSVNLSGGLSPGFMVDNTAYFRLDGEQLTLDRTEEFYPVIYNGLVGLGVGYAINSGFHINLNPVFKYSLRSIRKDHSIEYHPYSISLFTGISYTF